MMKGRENLKFPPHKTRAIDSIKATADWWGWGGGQGPLPFLPRTSGGQDMEGWEESGTCCACRGHVPRRTWPSFPSHRRDASVVLTNEFIAKVTPGQWNGTASLPRGPVSGHLCRNRWGVPSSTSAHKQQQSVTPKQCPVFCHCFSIQQSVCQLCGRFKNPSCFHTNRNRSFLLLQMFGFVDRCSNLCYSSPSALFGLGFFISPDTSRSITMLI